MDESVQKQHEKEHRTMDKDTMHKALHKKEEEIHDLREHLKEKERLIAMNNDLL